MSPTRPPPSPLPSKLLKFASPLSATNRSPSVHFRAATAHSEDGARGRNESQLQSARPELGGRHLGVWNRTRCTFFVRFVWGDCLLTVGAVGVLCCLVVIDYVFRTIPYRLYFAILLLSMLLLCRHCLWQEVYVL